ncbi:MAG: type III secretion system chaperone [Gemmataceae bacterium]
MKRLITTSILSLAVCAAALAFVASSDAQVRTGRRPADRTDSPAAADQLTNESLINMLRGLGYEPTIRRSGTADVAHMTIRKDDWTFDFDVTVSGNKQKVWLSCWFNALPRDLNAGELGALLKANLDFGPAHFTYQPATRQLNLGLPLDNRNITPDVLQREINYFIDTLKKTADLWDVR